VSGTEVRVTGNGSPVTVFAHGLGGSIDETRPFGSGVLGTRVFYSQPGHESSGGAGPRPWDYARLAALVRRVADDHAATRAVGVSLGAGALLRALADCADRFDRVVLVLPAALDRRARGSTDRLHRLAGPARRGDEAALAAVLLGELDPGVRDRADAVAWAREQAGRLVRPAVVGALAELPERAPLEDRAELRRCDRPVLVLGADGDPAHPPEIARAVAAALPRAQLVLLPPGGLLWTHRQRVRRLVTDFLDAARPR